MNKVAAYSAATSPAIADIPGLSAQLAARVRQFADFSAFRAFNPAGFADGEVFYIRAYGSAHDGGGGEFMWDAGFIGVAGDDDWDDPEDPDGPPLSEAAGLGVVDDDGTFLKPASIADEDPGRGRRIAAMSSTQLVRAEWFGADRTGGVPASAAIQRAHDALSVATFGERRRVHNLEDGSDTPAAARKYMRRGTVVLESGIYTLDVPLELSAQTILEGQGRQASVLQLEAGCCELSVPPAAPGYGDSDEETFYIRFSKPYSVNANNCFGTGIRSLSLLGGADAGDNTAASGAYVFGAQGSMIHDVSIRDFGFRCLYNLGVNITGNCWIEGCLRGPIIHLTGGPGNTHDSLSIEHCNKLALYVDPDTSRPYAALKIQGAHKHIFEQIQFEENPIDVELIDATYITIQRHFTSPIGGTVNGFSTYGVYRSGDTYEIDWPELLYLGGTTHLYADWDNSDITVGLGKQGLVASRRAPAPPNFTVTAVADDNGTPVTATITRKSESRGWYVNANTAAATTSDCTITIAGKSREWAGQDASFAGLYDSPYAEPGTVLGAFRVHRGSSDGLSGRLQRYALLGKGPTVALVADGADLTFGSNIPPAATITINNAGDPTITIAAANSATCSTDISFGIEIF